MAPTVIPRVPSGDHLRHISRSLSSTVSKLSIRDIASSQHLTSLFALIISSRSSISRRALTSIAELPSQHVALSRRSTDFLSAAAPHLQKRQSVILAIPTTYAGLDDGPAPGTVVGITLGTIGGFLICLYIVLLSVQFYGSRTVIKEEVVVKRRSHRSKSRRSSSRHSAGPPPRRETIVEIEEVIRRPSRRASPSPEPEEVIVEEEATTISEEIVEVIEEQSSIVSSVPPPPKRQSGASGGGRRSGFRTVDPAEFAGGSGQMRRVSRRTSGR